MVRVTGAGLCGRPRLRAVVLIALMGVLGSICPVRMVRALVALNPAGPVIWNLLKPVGEPVKVLPPALLPMKPGPPRVPMRKEVMRRAATRQSILPVASAVQVFTVPQGSLMV